MLWADERSFAPGPACDSRRRFEHLDLKQGKKYAEKPDGTGINVGWAYLSEALRYKSQDNLGAIHDEMATAELRICSNRGFRLKLSSATRHHGAMRETSRHSLQTHWRRAWSLRASM